jgi:hypothetical protein
LEQKRPVPIFGKKLASRDGRNDLIELQHLELPRYPLSGGCS